MSVLLEILKILGTIGGLSYIVSGLNTLITKYQMFPLHGQWHPLIKLDEAVLRSYEKHPEMGDPSRRVTGNDPLIWHFLALMQDAIDGFVTVYGKRDPSRIQTPIPRDALNVRRVSNDRAKLTFDDSEWSDLSVRLCEFRKHTRRVPAIVLRSFGSHPEAH